MPETTCCNPASILVRLQVLPGGVLQQIGSFRHNSQEHGEEKKGFVQGKPLYCKQDKKGWRESLITVSHVPRSFLCSIYWRKRISYSLLSQKPNWGIFSITQSAGSVCIQQQLLNPIAPPHCSPLPCEAWQHPWESWILTGSPLLCLHQPTSPSLPWHFGVLSDALFNIRPQKCISSCYSERDSIRHRNSLPPSLFLFPLLLILGHSLHALLIQITVAFKTKECRTPGHSTRERRLDECLMETPVSPAAGHGLHVPALTGSRTQGRPHSMPLSTSSLGKGAKREGET